MPNLWPALPSGTAKTVNSSASLLNKYREVNSDRQTRHDARERRRRGDWEILEIPTALLWLDEVCVAAAMEGDFGCPVLPMVDLWP